MRNRVVRDDVSSDGQSFPTDVIATVPGAVAAIPAVTIAPCSVSILELDNETAKPHPRLLSLQTIQNC
jgi:hypothetical protein